MEPNIHAGFDDSECLAAPDVVFDDIDKCRGKLVQTFLHKWISLAGSPKARLTANNWILSVIVRFLGRKE